jgi:L-seryl-tRNA(Ser) seleniumtransferase
MTDRRRSLPAVGVVLELDGVRELLEHAPRAVVTDAARAVIDAARRSASSLERGMDWPALVAEEVSRRLTASLRPLFNATGVVLHTNLGRAPLAPAAVEAIARIAAHGANVEYDLERGERGSRDVHCATLLRDLTGAEDALVVNNCAAALVLALNTFANGAEAIVSRGELIEIGGSFRVPDIMARSGAILREVGTTNRTHADDYRRALGRGTRAIVKVHRSNFEIRGFVAEAELRDLAPIAREAAVPLLFDFGSGLMLSLEPYGLHGEPTARDGIAAGATLVLMSGDKLLGGPQAGVLIGARQAIDACRRNPLARAVRVDKLTLAALEATLSLYHQPERAVREIPALAMITIPAQRVGERARALASSLAGAGIVCVVEEAEGEVGGGAFPSARLPSWAVVLPGDPEQTAARLRRHVVPIIGRIANGRLLLDPRSVPEPRDDEFVAAVRSALTTA